MKLLYILAVISMIVWICAAVRQYGGFFSAYFITLALADPVSLILRLSKIDIKPLQVFTFFMIVALYVLYKEKGAVLPKPVKTAAIIFLFGSLIVTNSIAIINWLYIAANLLLILEFIKRFIISLTNNKINLHSLILVIYGLTLIIKFIVNYNHTQLGTEYFITTSIFQILVGVFYVIFKEDNPKILLNSPKSLHVD